TRDVERDRVGAVRGHRRGEARRDGVERLVPGRTPAADRGMEQAAFEAERLRERSGFGAEPARVRGMLRIAGDHEARAAGLRLRGDDAAADAAVRARRADGRHARAVRVAGAAGWTATRIRPSSIRTGKRAVAPSSGPVASPLSRSMTHS